MEPFGDRANLLPIQYRFNYYPSSPPGLESGLSLLNWGRHLIRDLDPAL